MGCRMAMAAIGEVARVRLNFVGALLFDGLLELDRPFEILVDDKFDAVLRFKHFRFDFSERCAWRGRQASSTPERRGGRRDDVRGGAEQ